MQHNQRTLTIALAKVRHHEANIFYLCGTPAEILHLVDAGARPQRAAQLERVRADMVRCRNQPRTFYFTADRAMLKRFGDTQKE